MPSPAGGFAGNRILRCPMDPGSYRKSGEKRAGSHPGGQHIRISWKRSPAMLRLMVEDDGCGISPEDLPHIFKRFYTGRGPAKSPGIGLGLPLARAILEGQDGLLTVSSAAGQGTCFTLSFLTES